MRAVWKIGVLAIAIVAFSAGVVGVAFWRGKGSAATCVRVRGNLNVSRVIMHHGRTAIATDAERVLACRNVAGVLEPIIVVMGEVRGTAVIRGVPKAGDPITVLDPASGRSATLELVEYSPDDLGSMKVEAPSTGGRGSR